MRQMLIPFLAAVGLNVLIFVVLRISQSANPGLPRRYSYIPGTRQRFNHVQDYWTMTAGNLVGLSLIDASFFGMVADGQMIVGEWVVFAVIAVIGFIVFSMLNSREAYKSDYAFPKTGEVSAAGLVMLLNLGFHIALAVMVLWNLYAHGLGGIPVMWFAVIGAVVYAVCFVIDAMSGNFDPKETTRN